MKSEIKRAARELIGSRNSRVIPNRFHDKGEAETNFFIVRWPKNEVQISEEGKRLCNGLLIYGFTIMTFANNVEKG